MHAADTVPWLWTSSTKQQAGVANPGGMVEPGERLHTGSGRDQ